MATTTTITAATTTTIVATITTTITAAATTITDSWAEEWSLPTLPSHWQFCCFSVSVLRR